MLTKLAATRRDVYFALAVGVLALVLLSPLEKMAHSLASAHMVQHVLLILVVGPLFALAANGETILRRLPLVWRKRLGRLRRRTGLLPTTTRRLFSPTFFWLLHAGTLWFWHASGPYAAAVRSPLLHATEHVLFLITAALFWSAVGVGARRVSSGLGILLVFAMALQGVLLSALITFAKTPWYSVYETTTAAYGLDPLVDQQLAGAIMWVPAGLAYTGIGLALLIAWIRAEGGPWPTRSTTT